MVTVRERWLTWEGMRYRVWERLVPGSDAPPLVLVHGYAASLEQWGRFLRDIGPEVPAVAVDLVGFGQSSKPRRAPYGRAFFIRQLEHLRRHYGWRRVAVVGHSMGGMVAIEWAGAHPDAVEAIIAIAPGGMGPTVEVTRRQQRVLNVLARPGLTRLLYTTAVRLPYRWLIHNAYADPASTDPTTEVALRAALRSKGATWSYSAPMRTPGAFSITAHAEDIRCPLHLIWGRKDALLPMHLAERFVARFPQATVTLLPGGHCVHEERSREVVAEVRTLLTLDGLLAPGPAPVAVS